MVFKVFKSMDLVQSYPSLFQVLWYSINPCFDIRWNLVWITQHFTNTEQLYLSDLHSQLTIQWLFYSGKNSIHAITCNQFSSSWKRFHQGLDVNIPRPEVDNQALQMEGLSTKHSLLSGMDSKNMILTWPDDVWTWRLTLTMMIRMLFSLAGRHNLRSFLAANLTQNYFLIARMLRFFVTFATKVPYLTFCDKMWQFLI